MKNKFVKKNKCKQSAEIVTRKINQHFRKHSLYSDVLAEHESQKVFSSYFSNGVWNQTQVSDQI